MANESFQNGVFGNSLNLQCNVSRVGVKGIRDDRDRMRKSCEFLFLK